jgi:signal peptidase I
MQKLQKFLLWTIGIAVVLVVILRFTLFEVWTIPNDPWLAASIAPTLSGGDTVLVLTRGTPALGDLVRCKDPEKPDKSVVGRIVGMPGDSVEIRGPTLTVNSTNYIASEACEKPTFTVKHPESGHETTFGCSRVEMRSGWHFRGTATKATTSNDKTAQVGAGRYYLLSDNRDLHDDSRDFGALPQESCKRRIVFRLWGAKGWSDSEHRMTFIR